MKKPDIRTIGAWVGALLIVFLIGMALLFARKVWKEATGNVSKTSIVKEQNDRFMPTGYGTLWNLNEKFVIVTDVTTGEEYMFVQGCGAVRLEKKLTE